MRKTLLVVLLAVSAIAKAQLSKSITEESPFVSDGIEYGYSVKNVSTRDVSKKDFSRYQVTLYATNKSECSRVILFNQSLNESEEGMKVLAKFDCVNATGARLTSKTGDVSAKPMFVTAKVSTRDEKGKATIENQKVQIGYFLGVGETVQNEVIFIVPLDAKPDIKVRIVNRVSTL